MTIPKGYVDDVVKENFGDKMVHLSIPIVEANQSQIEEGVIIYEFKNGMLSDITNNGVYGKSQKQIKILVNTANSLGVKNSKLAEGLRDEDGYVYTLDDSIFDEKVITYIGTNEYFNRYLHNGQKLGSVTTIEPKGKLFYDFIEAGIDAVNGSYFKSYFEVLRIKSNPYDIVALLVLAEIYNGLGYYNNGIINPYLYSGTSIYTADGSYDPDTVDIW